ncbi:MAG: 2-oxoglutarate dehydrogenase complex dihydrolipoyllysine-residue succinyltransferase [Lentimicrobium sp.]|jgi:2-oxoglutarate dehydrogenase E2 component (dihydrolipoamide succinyltransferase)|nr:2-oxoglutarate dehydrogenase complex dihydrolipoyllysine-residue succinyltransferase [Lentimicrobium sp.]MDD2527060.1 2-oxoglutarate dehydrogenase complex dihydrolipoyllysine-residue succinyltransferase [Lentimicrobiaceae bacterium]MDD4597621.1 2-oxoglutarate dehydrogenase complex dihydrolipoyllysine-residue succinyltransferase [Lentimicrobiaceae bacterium]MDY0026270.1 2-oxoglutarate dehydrogenase complex dihydrolipoyllysine-residue succinyltransferase [Lentimicrobium sp.]
MAMIDIKVPSPGESITEVQLASWLVNDGDYVEKDAEIAEIDSDKATLTINASAAGVIHQKTEAGETVDVGSVIAQINTEETGPKTKTTKPGTAPETKTAEAKPETEKIQEAEAAATDEEASPPSVETQKEIKLHVSPLARRIMDEKSLKNQDIIDYINRLRIGKAEVEEVSNAMKSAPSSPQLPKSSEKGERKEDRRKMSALRTKLAKRLVSVKNETAMLTTFNEVNMSRIIEIRKKYNDKFKEKHGISLGFMSFFTKAITIALEQFPQVNAQIDGEDLIFYNYADIGIAVSAPKGLVVPVIRNAESLSLAGIEHEIRNLANKARDNKITLEEMTGGTFTITNGGVFGSMMSTPIINPPQSAILGMHNIVERPIAVKGQVVIAPMMYVALSYDHRVIDGKESVSFLVKVKEMLEAPETMFYEGIDPLTSLLEL